MLIECKECEAVVNAEVIRSYTKSYYPENPIVKKFSFLKCTKCNEPIIVSQESYFDEAFEDPYRIYPPQDRQVNPSFPEPIKNAYQEALSCFKSKAFTASAIMCRKTLEGICRVHDVNTGKLVSDLKKMKDKGIIETLLFEWAEALRISGNEAAHDVDVTISRQDAKDIIEFTDALLEYVFTYRDKFNEFEKRRQFRKEI